uniref:CG18508 n=1 Tax=Acartia pacifica TaxID=335913 RepID=A0A0U2USD6_ACAPC|nr:CG18508 [Acartia pacifica]
MVCISCIVIPLLLWIWHRFLQPVFLKFYNPWAGIENKTDPSNKTGDTSTTAAKCPFTGKMSNGGGEAHQEGITTTSSNSDAGDKKSN